MAPLPRDAVAALAQIPHFPLPALLKLLVGDPEQDARKVCGAVIGTWWGSPGSMGWHGPVAEICASHLEEHFDDRVMYLLSQLVPMESVGSQFLAAGLLPKIVAALDDAILRKCESSDSIWETCVRALRTVTVGFIGCDYIDPRHAAVNDEVWLRIAQKLMEFLEADAMCLTDVGAQELVLLLGNLFFHRAALLTSMLPRAVKRVVRQIRMLIQTDEHVKVCYKLVELDGLVFCDEGSCAVTADDVAHLLAWWDNGKPVRLLNSKGRAGKGLRAETRSHFYGILANCCNSSTNKEEVQRLVSSLTLQLATRYVQKPQATVQEKENLFHLMSCSPLGLMSKLTKAGIVPQLSADMQEHFGELRVFGSSLLANLCLHPPAVPLLIQHGVVPVAVRCCRESEPHLQRQGVRILLGCLECVPRPTSLSEECKSANLRSVLEQVSGQPGNFDSSNHSNSTASLAMAALRALPQSAADDVHSIGMRSTTALFQNEMMNEGARIRQHLKVAAETAVYKTLGGDVPDTDDSAEELAVAITHCPREVGLPGRDHDSCSVQKLKDMGNESFRTKNYRHAARCYVSAVTLADKAGGIRDDNLMCELHANLALVRIKQARYISAVVSARLAQRHRPTWDKALYRECLALFGARDLVSALQVADAALRRHPAHPPLLALRQRILKCTSSDTEGDYECIKFSAVASDLRRISDDLLSGCGPRFVEAEFIAPLLKLLVHFPVTIARAVRLDSLADRFPLHAVFGLPEVITLFDELSESSRALSLFALGLARRSLCEHDASASRCAAWLSSWISNQKFRKCIGVANITSSIQRINFVSSKSLLHLFVEAGGLPGLAHLFAESPSKAEPMEEWQVALLPPAAQVMYESCGRVGDFPRRWVAHVFAVVQVEMWRSLGLDACVSISRMFFEVAFGPDTDKEIASHADRAFVTFAKAVFSGKWLAPECAFCGGLCQGNTVCSGCLLKRFCSVKCQHAAWPEHRIACKAWFGMDLTGTPFMKFVSRPSKWSDRTHRDRQDIASDIVRDWRGGKKLSQLERIKSCMEEAVLLAFRAGACSTCGPLFFKPMPFDEYRELFLRKKLGIGAKNVFSERCAFSGTTRDRSACATCAPLLVEVKSLLREVLDVDPRHSAAHEMLAELLLRTGGTQESVQEYKAILQADPNNLSARTNLGNALMAQGDLTGAAHSLGVAASSSATARYNLAICLEEKDDIDGAIREYNLALQADPNYTSAHYNLGCVLAAKGDAEGAIREFRAVLALESNDTAAHYNLGCALSEVGDDLGAIKQYRRVLELNPAEADARTNLAGALLRVGDMYDAKKELEVVLDANPNHKVALRLLNSMQSAKRKRVLFCSRRSHDRASRLVP